MTLKFLKSEFYNFCISNSSSGVPFVSLCSAFHFHFHFELAIQPVFHFLSHFALRVVEWDSIFAFSNCTLSPIFSLEVDSRIFSIFYEKTFEFSSFRHLPCQLSFYSLPGEVIVHLLISDCFVARTRRVRRCSSVRMPRRPWWSTTCGRPRPTRSSSAALMAQMHMPHPSNSLNISLRLRQVRTFENLTAEKYNIEKQKLKQDMIFLKM